MAKSKEHAGRLIHNYNISQSPGHRYSNNKHQKSTIINVHKDKVSVILDSPHSLNEMGN